MYLISIKKSQLFSIISNHIRNIAYKPIIILNLDINFIRSVSFEFVLLVEQY